jgi:ribosome maturation factor RimP
MSDKQAATYGSSVADKVAAIVEPMATALGLEIYDIDYSGGTLKVVLDTPAGGPAGVSLDDLALVTRQLGRELDHSDPVPGRYTLEVTSPGLERTLRRPQHFIREVGKTVNIRLHSAVNGMRRIQGELIAATLDTITVRNSEANDLSTIDINIADIERARTVFVWERAEKPGKAPTKKSAKKTTKKSEESNQSEELNTEANAS